jgi:poly(3-hydroxybutyrate) depolymerase
MTSGGKTRTYHLFVPEKAQERVPAPLMVLLHGSGRRGPSLVEPWTSLSKKEGIILVAPDSIDINGWQIPEDGPDFIHELVESLRASYQIDPRRIYLFGHSAGAIQALYLSVLEPEYFAAAAIHAGAIDNNNPAEWLNHAQRKIPIAMWVGTHDALFPLTVVRATRDVLKARGFPVTLTEVNGHTHNYYSRASEINPQVWSFLQQHELESDPRYQLYNMQIRK